jgi:hypothetical protein
VLRARELLVAALVLAGLGALVFYPHVRSGGFYSDDWASAATYHFSAPSRFLHAFQAYQHTFGTRPLLSAAKAGSYAVLGLHTGWHLALAVVLGVLVSLALYAVLRKFAIGAVPALVVAALALLFPWSDSTRLWSTASLNQLATLFYLLGLLVALAGLERRRRGAILCHVAALVLYAVGMLVYEAVAGLVLLSGAFYGLYLRGRWAQVWKLWLADILLTLGVLGWSASGATAARPAPSVHKILHDLPHFVHQALSLGIHALAPGLPVLVPVVIVAVVAAVAVVRWRRGELTGDARRWLAVAGAAVLASAAAFVPLVGSGLHPLDLGLNNRGNVAAALPVSLFVFAAIAVAVHVLLPRRSAMAAAWVTVTLGVVVVLGYAHLIRNDVGRWDRAAVLQHRVLSALHSALARPSAGEVAYTYGVPALVSPGVSVFSEFWDEPAAFRIQTGDPQVSAFPIVQGTTFVCTASGVYPQIGPGPYDALQGGFGPPEGARYGRAILVDVLNGRSTVITGPRQCRAATAHLPLAPLVG